ncbi:MAG: hypothetical protein ACYDA1_05330 [Vulcanimicrobiaceae bacterium]
MNRLFVAAAFCMLVGLPLVPGPTSAAVPLNVPVEYCAARVHDWRTQSAKPGLLAYDLEAYKARVTNGDVLIRTSLGWFSAPFANVSLRDQAQRWKTSTITFERNVFESSELFVQLPKHVRVLSMWVRDASANAKSDRLTCAGVPQLPLDKNRDKDKNVNKKVTRLNPRPDPLLASPASNSAVATAVLTSPPGLSTCSMPDRNAKVIRKARFSYNTGAYSNVNVVSEVELAISGKGQPDAAWTYVPSGSAELDAKTLDAAQRSLYRPARAFCQLVPGYYFFTVIYMSH